MTLSRALDEVYPTQPNIDGIILTEDEISMAFEMGIDDYIDALV